MVHRVTLQRLGRSGAPGIAIIDVDAPDSQTARAEARRLGEARYGSVGVLVDHSAPDATVASASPIELDRDRSFVLRLTTVRR